MYKFSKSFILLAFFLAPFMVGNLAAQEQVTLKGTIYAYDTDEEGNVISVYLETTDEVYLINPAGKGAELMDYLDSSVTVKGTVKQDGDGNMVLTVASFTTNED